MDKYRVVSLYLLRAGRGKAWNGAFVQLPEVLELPQVSAKTKEESEIQQKISKQYQAILYDYLPVLNQSFAICDVDLDGREKLIFL